jgi:hypothetical protein
MPTTTTHGATVDLRVAVDVAGDEAASLSVVDEEAVATIITPPTVPNVHGVEGRAIPRSNASIRSSTPYTA